MRRRASAQPLSAAHPTFQRVVQELGRPESVIARRMKDIAHQLVAMKSRSTLALGHTRFIALQARQPGPQAEWTALQEELEELISTQDPFEGKGCDHLSSLLNGVASRLDPCIWEAAMRPLAVEPVPPALPPSVAPVPFDGMEPPLVFSNGDFLGQPSILPSDLLNVLAVGETGSGKTVNGITPVMAACLKYQIDGKAMSMLLIDPKVELVNLAERQLASQGEGERIRLVGRNGAIRYFENDGQRSVADRFKQLSQFVFPSGHDHGHNAGWVEKAHLVLRTLLRADLAFLHQSGVGLFETVIGLVDSEFRSRGQWHALGAFINLPQGGRISLNGLNHVVEALLQLVGLGVDLNPLAQFREGDSMMLEQYMYRQTYMNIYAERFGAPELQGLIDFSLRPHVQTAAEPVLDVDASVAAGHVIAFQPGSSFPHEVAAMALKAKFFEAVFRRQDMHRPVAYIVDEFQRFVTGDHETGDQNFLDRCRAYRAVAVMATQSVASIEDRVSRSQFAARVMLANIVTKVFFRSNEGLTTETLRRLLPLPPGSMPHVLDARPLSLLGTGECYWQRRGVWGRHQHVLATQS